MSTLTSYASAAARDSAAPASSNTGLCIFRSDTKAIEVSDGNNYLSYNNDGFAATYSSNSYSGSFDGTNDYVDISAASSIVNSVTALSISLWYKQDTAGGVLIGTGTSNTNGIWLQPYTDGNFYAVLRNGGTNTLTATRPALNTWVHTVLTYDAGTIKLYLTPNGGTTDVTTITSGPSTTSSTTGNNLSIGRLAWNTGDPFYLDGNIDEVALFDYALSSTQVSSIYNNKEYYNPKAVWRFENDVTDETGSYNGTNNGVTFVTSTKPY